MAIIRLEFLIVLVWRKKKIVFYKRSGLRTQFAYLSSVALAKMQKGDSLYSIAKKYGATVDQLRECNGLHDSSIQAGADLKIPTESPSTHPPSPTHVKIDNQIILEWEDSTTTISCSAHCPYNVKKHTDENGIARFVEQNPQSGVTVAGGVDLGQHSAEDLSKMGVKANIIGKLQGYFGL